jgi:hypothetical protein
MRTPPHIAAWLALNLATLIAGSQLPRQVDGMITELWRADRAKSFRVEQSFRDPAS